MYAGKILRENGLSLPPDLSMSDLNILLYIG